MDAEARDLRRWKQHVPDDVRLERWPAGAPDIYRDIDNSPTKKYMMEQGSDPGVRRLFELAFGKKLENGYAVFILNAFGNGNHAAALFFEDRSDIFAELIHIKRFLRQIHEMRT